MIVFGEWMERAERDRESVRAGWCDGMVYEVAEWVMPSVALRLVRYPILTPLPSASSAAAFIPHSHSFCVVR